MAYITIFSYKGPKKVNTPFFFLLPFFLNPQKKEGEKEEGNGLG